MSAFITSTPPAAASVPSSSASASASGAFAVTPEAYLAWLHANPRPPAAAEGTAIITSAATTSAVAAASHWQLAHDRFLGPDLKQSIAEAALEQYLHLRARSFIQAFPPPSLDDWDDDEEEENDGDNDSDHDSDNANDVAGRGDLYKSQHPAAVAFRMWAMPLMECVPKDLTSSVDFGYAFLLNLIDRMMQEEEEETRARLLPSPPPPLPPHPHPPLPIATANIVATTTTTTIPSTYYWTLTLNWEKDFRGLTLEEADTQLINHGWRLRELVPNPAARDEEEWWHRTYTLQTSGISPGEMQERVMLHDLCMCSHAEYGFWWGLSGSRRS